MDEHALHWRPRRVSCTVCTWRGTWADAEDAPKVKRPSVIPPPIEQLQSAMEEKEQAAMELGTPHPPPCPACGHHVRVLPHHSVRPKI